MGLCGLQWSGMVTKTGEDWRISKGVNVGGCIALQGIIFRIRVQRRSETHKKVEGKVVPVHPLHAYGWSRGMAPLILNLDTR